MTLTRKILIVVLVFLGVGLGWLAFIFSHNAACDPALAPSDNAELMSAVVYRCYGPPDVLSLEKIEKPAPADDEVLVKVHAAAANPLDWHYMRGTPYIMRIDAGFGRPKITRLGVDFAGTVEAVGKNVTRFRPGDEVFGGRTGSFAEYVTIREERTLALKPANLSFEQAAAVPIAAITALQALRDKGRIQAGQKVLINGASGGVGTFAVQIAKACGAEVTGVCSTRNVELVRSIGADHVVDYTREDFREGAERYDVILDNVGDHSMAATRRALAPNGTLFSNGGGHSPDKLGRVIRAAIASMVVRQQARPSVKNNNRADLLALKELVEAGKVTPVIGGTYSLAQTAEAIGHVAAGHARGTVVIAVSRPSPADFGSESTPKVAPVAAAAVA